MVQSNSFRAAERRTLSNRIWLRVARGTLRSVSERCGDRYAAREVGGGQHLLSRRLLRSIDERRLVPPRQPPRQSFQPMGKGVEHPRRRLFRLRSRERFLDHRTRGAEVLPPVLVELG